MDPSSDLLEAFWATTLSLRPSGIGETAFGLLEFQCL